MRTDWRRMRWMFRGHFLFHPSAVRLQAWLDQELAAGQSEAIRRHTMECDRCLQAANRGQEAMAWFRIHDKHGRSSSEDEIGDGLQRMEATIRSYACGLAAPGKTNPFLTGKNVFEDQTVSELQAYLGKRMLSNLVPVLEKSPQKIPVLLHETEPLLATFLGRKTAELIRFKISIAAAGL